MLPAEPKKRVDNKKRRFSLYTKTPFLRRGSGIRTHDPLLPKQVR